MSDEKGSTAVEPLVVAAVCNAATADTRDEMTTCGWAMIDCALRRAATGRRGKPAKLATSSLVRFG